MKKQNPQGLSSQINYGQRLIEFNVRFCAKPKFVRKVRIHVHCDGTVEVEAPDGTQIKDIRKAVSKRGKWLTKHLESFEKNRSNILPRQYVSGETHFYLGRRYVLKIKSSVLTSPDGESVRLLGGRFEILTSENTKEHVHYLLDAWYKERAQELIPMYLEAVVSRASWIRKVPDIKLRTMKKRWGSCSSRGVISLNSRLVCAPKECINYVLWHEICHIKEPNHSKRFYGLLSRHLPDWEVTKRRLDEMAELLLEK